MAPTLGYWDIRGLGEPIRYLLHYKNVDFEDKRYTDMNTWLGEKFRLDLNFPNLPYFIDGDIRLTQSLAIIRHLARKYSLDGSNENEKRQVQLIEQQIMDFANALAVVCYDENFESQNEAYKKILPSSLALWSTFLGKKKFLVGDDLTYVDFIAYYAFDFHEIFHPQVYKDFPTIEEYCRRFTNMPELRNYLKSSTYKRWPIYTPIAIFGGAGDEPDKIH